MVSKLLLLSQSYLIASEASLYIMSLVIRGLGICMPKFCGIVNGMRVHGAQNERSAHAQISY